MDFRVLNEPRDVTGLKVSRDPSNPARALAIDFAILERDDGAKIQVIYEGDPDADLAVAGSIEGPSPIERYRPSSYYRRGFSTLGFIAAFLVIGTVHFFMFGIPLQLCADIWPNRKKAIGAAGVALTIIGLISSLILSLLFISHVLTTFTPYPRML